MEDDTNEEVKRRAEFVKRNVGEDALNVLKESGIDVDGAINRIIGEQVKREGELAIERQIPLTSNMLTSELVYNSESLGDTNGQAYVNRLRMIGLDDTHIQGLYQAEASILSRGRDSFGRTQPWAGRYFFMQGMKKEDLPKFDELTLSELILITDDATAAYVRDHHWLLPETWNAVCEAAIQAYSMGGAKYALAFKERVKKMGWSEEQDGSYTRNECMITERLKWGKDNGLAWTPETTKLELYKR